MATDEWCVMDTFVKGVDGVPSVISIEMGDKCPMRGWQYRCVITPIRPHGIPDYAWNVPVNQPTITIHDSQS